jgi:photosystem II stability/assembly factor-like uncharacterized protein
MHGFSEYFDIRPRFQITKPDYNTVWYTGQQGIVVEWEDAELGGSVRISLLRGSVLIDDIAPSTENDGEYLDYDYIVPIDLEEDDNYRIEVHYSDKYNSRSVYFDIVHPPTEGNYAWETVSPLSILNDVHVIDHDIAIGVGDSGRIIRTENSGRTWTTIESGTQSRLNGISMSSPLVGTAVGYGNTVLRTVDGGITWERQDSGISGSYYDVSQINDTTAFACGVYDRIIRTRDGGESWEMVHEGGFDLHAICFADTDTGWAGGKEGTYLRTEDGGDTWIQVDLGLNPYAVITDFDFLDNDTGAFAYYSVGPDHHSSIMMMTYDGGGTWDGILSIHYAYSENPCLSFLDAETCVFSGTRPHRTTDGGSSWTQLPHHMFRQMNGIDLHQSGFGVGVGSHGVVMRTLDSGATWQSVGAVEAPVYNVEFVSPELAIAVGIHQLIMISTNGGQNWLEQHSVDGAPSLHSVSFTDPDAGMAAGDAGSILGTTDGGTSWTVLSSGISANIKDIEMISGLTAVAVGTGGTIIRTSDGGTGWSQIDSGTTGDLNAVFFSSPGHGTIVGQNGIVLTTLDGGTTWAEQSGPAAIDLYDVVFSDDMNGIAVGVGIILRTADGGANWEILNVPIDETLLSAEHIGGGTVIAVGKRGLILRTYDWGNNWVRQFSSVSTDLGGVSFIDWQDGIITGWDISNGTAILRTTTGGE